MVLNICTLVGMMWSFRILECDVAGLSLFMILWAIDFEESICWVVLVVEIEELYVQ